MVRVPSSAGLQAEVERRLPRRATTAHAHAAAMCPKPTAKRKGNFFVWNAGSQKTPMLSAQSMF
jgi:hypothetical protein